MSRDEDRGKDHDDATAISQSLQDLAHGIAHYFDEKMGEPLGFVLVVSVAGTAQYIGNVERADGMQLLEKVLDWWKVNGADIPVHTCAGHSTSDH